MCKIKKKDYFMGAIADRSFNMYGTGKDQIDIAKQMRLSGYINPKDQIGITIASQIPSIFMSLAQKIVDVCGDYNSELTDGELSELGEDIQNQIKTVLDKHGCESIQDLEDTYNQYNEELNTERRNIETQDEIIKNTNLQIDGITQEINTLNLQLEACRDLLNKSDTPFTAAAKAETEARIAALEAQIAEKEKTINQLNTNKEVAERSKNASETKINELNGIVQDLKSALDEVNKLATNLRRNDGQDGRDVIKNMCNDDTNSICELVRELSKTTDEIKKTELKNSLESALNEYTKNHKQGDSKTIDLLIQRYGITWTESES